MGDSRAPARRLIVVAGMHRAGTSVIARGLLALGVDLGPRLMSADMRMNARGFFEDMDVVALDDALLAACGADWKSVALLDDVDWGDARFASERDVAQKLLEDRLSRTGLFGVKDPRMPRLLPFWQRVAAAMGVDDRYVIAVRHPSAVIDSLTARDGLEQRRSAWLWVEHVLCSLYFTRGRPRAVVDYDRLLEQPDAELARIAAALDLRPDHEEVRRFCEDFLTLDLRHARYPRESVTGAAATPFGADVHALVQALASGDMDPQSAEATAGIDALFARLREWSPLLGYAGSVEQAADRVPGLEGELTWARGSLAESAAYNEDLRQAVVRSETYSVDLKAALDRTETEFATLRERLRERILGRLLLRQVERKRNG